MKLIHVEIVATPSESFSAGTKCQPHNLTQRTSGGMFTRDPLWVGKRQFAGGGRNHQVGMQNTGRGLGCVQFKRCSLVFLRANSGCKGQEQSRHPEQFPRTLHWSPFRVPYLSLEIVLTSQPQLPLRRRVTSRLAVPAKSSGQPELRPESCAYCLYPRGDWHRATRGRRFFLFPPYPCPRLCPETWLDSASRSGAPASESTRLRRTTLVP